jgi:hypothetical protein
MIANDRLKVLDLVIAQCKESPPSDRNSSSLLVMIPEA